MATVQMLCQAAYASPGYQAMLAKLPTKVCQLADGRAVSHEDIAQAAVISYARLRKQPEHMLLCGAKPGKQKKRERALRAAVKADVAAQYGLELPGSFELWLAGLATFVGIAFGPVALFTIVLESILGWLIESELSKKFDFDAIPG